MIPKFLLALCQQFGIYTKNDDEHTDQVFKALLRATKSYTNMIQCKFRIQMLKKLYGMKLGTATIEESIKKLCVLKSGKTFNAQTKNKI